MWHAGPLDAQKRKDVNLLALNKYPRQHACQMAMHLVLGPMCVCVPSESSMDRLNTTPPSRKKIHVEVV